MTFPSLVACKQWIPAATLGLGPGLEKFYGRAPPSKILPYRSAPATTAVSCCPLPGSSRQATEDNRAAAGGGGGGLLSHVVTSPLCAALGRKLFLFISAFRSRSRRQRRK